MFKVNGSTIAVVGGGRWAKVIVAELCLHIDASNSIIIYANKSAPSVERWAFDNCNRVNVSVMRGVPQLTDDIDFAIIVNAASDHESAIISTLHCSVPTLVEKPMVLNLESANHVIKLYRDSNVVLSSAHVFLFTSFVWEYSQVLRQCQTPQSLSFIWQDSVSELRHGIEKAYDASLPVFVDVLPHVNSLIDFFFPDGICILLNVDFQKGGMHVEVELNLNGIKCNLIFIRNGFSRKRVVEVYDQDNTYTLDFSNEPATISIDDVNVTTTQQKVTNFGPLSRMLSTFLAAPGKDIRLSTDIALASCRLSDKIHNLYAELRMAWLKAKISEMKKLDCELEYCLTEILLSDGYLSKNEIKLRLERIFKFHQKKKNSVHMKSIMQVNDHKLFELKILGVASKP